MPDETPVDPYPLFSKEPKALAFDASVIADVIADESLHAPLPEVPRRPDSRMVPCICGGRDQTDGPLVLRALLYPGTATVTPLTDGRVAYRGYWTLAVLAAVDDYGAEELSDEEFAALRYQPDPQP